MKKMFVMGLAMVIMFVMVGSSNAGYEVTSMSVNSGWVALGDYKYQVIKLAGEPIDKDIVLTGTKGSSRLEHWVYEQGSVFYIVVIRNGKVSKIEWVRK